MITVKRQNRIDWITVMLYVTLVVAGWCSIYAAVYDEQHASIFTFSQRYGKQMIWIIAAAIIAAVVCLLDVHLYTRLAWPVYIVCILALAAVLVAGVKIHEARSWFAIGSLQIQPSEFAKIAVSLALAKFVCNLNGHLMDIKNIAIAAGIIFLPPLLISQQPDVGSCLVFLAFFIVLYREGLHPAILLFGMLAAVLFVLSLLLRDVEERLLAGIITVGFAAYWFKTRSKAGVLKGAGLAAGICILLWLVNLVTGEHFELHQILLGGALISSSIFLAVSFFRRIPVIRAITLFITGVLLFTASVDFVFDELLSDYHRKRILITIGMESDPKGIEYNVIQSKIAIGSGGFAGKGFLQGTQTKYNFVPEQSTDFIFCTIGEEWGFIGTAAVIILFVTFLLRLLFIAERQRSVFSRVYSYCVLSIFFLHITINIGMTIGLLPVIGIPLPFFSYGGSSLWAFTILLFIMLRLDTSREEYIR